MQHVQGSLAWFWGVCVIAGDLDYFSGVRITLALYMLQKTGINTPPGPVKVAALASWSLLLSTLDPQRVSLHHLQS